jgi:4-hydroxy-2-oxoglutarate aldolase
MRFQGIFPPVVTPFQPDGGLDLRAFEVNFATHAQQAFAGFLVLGSNGEAGSLDVQEKLALVRAARRQAAGRLLLVGTGCESTSATIALTRAVADEGADAALVLTPHYYRAQMTSEALRRHFVALADASPIPVLLYSVPQFTGLTFPVELAADLATHPNVHGMKESSGDIGLLGRITTRVPASYSVLCGAAPVLYPALCLGASGGIVAVACCAPRAVLALEAAFRAGQHARALQLQRLLAPLATAVSGGHGVAGLKAAMDLCGLQGGLPRAPLLPVTPAVRTELAGLLRRLDDDLNALDPPA